MKRQCGILMPIFSLPSRFGIGCFDKEAYAFIDFLKESGQSMWQVLPFCQTGFGDSPYQSVSSFAGNPYFIDLEQLIGDGLLTWQECESVWFGSDQEKVDYGAMYENRYPLLRKAYERFRESMNGRLHCGAAQQAGEYKAFLKKEAYWLEDYALFMSIKQREQGKSWQTWEEGLKMREPGALEKVKRELENEMGFYYFQQYEFTRHWEKLHAYAKKQGISIIGDIPFYVAMDSAASWAHKEIFLMDKEGNPTQVAGCAPDAFSKTGQLWGNPLYKWDYHEKTGYKWWLKRIAHCYKIYDVVRIDHFRGFDEYYAIPYGHPTAEHGKWKKGPGYKLFDAMKKELGEKRVIAEDLGFLTESVIKLVKKTGYPGMKILQFAFDSREESDYLPHNYTKNCIVYTGTHDNDTTRNWFDTLPRADKKFCKEYLGIKKSSDAVWAVIRSAFASVSDTVIIPMQDYLELPGYARITTPSTLGGNWVWRLKKDALAPELAGKMKDFARIYRRLP